MANPYDVNVVFAELEQELIKSFKRNMSKYVDTSDMWQAMKMKDLEMYRREMAQEISSATKRAKRLSKIVLKDDFLKGADKVDAFMKQFNLSIKTTSKNDFFRLNRRKLNAMLEGVYGDLDKASHAIYRQMDDVYRQTLFKAQIAKDSGVFTPEQAVDVATKDFLDKGINCVKYKNGALVNVASYAEMAIRTASKKAMLTAEGARNQEWGVTTIQITQHGSTCELCSPWQGRVLIDDVYSGGKPQDGPYPLLSTAMAEGLFHPNCRHGSGTYFEGISETPELYNEAEVEGKYEKEQQQRYNERKIREWKRKANGSMDEGNKRKAEEKVRYWQSRQRELLDENDWLRRKYGREGTKGIGLEKKLPKVKSVPIEKSGLTHQPLSSTTGYTGTTSSSELNELLRYGENTKQYSEVIERLDSNMETVQHTTTLYRGVGQRFFAANEKSLGINSSMSFEEMQQALSGKVFTDKGYMSTTHTSNNDYGEILMRIEATPGTKALWTGNDKEREVILGRGQSFKIKRAYREKPDDPWSRTVLDIIRV